MAEMVWMTGMLTIEAMKTLPFTIHFNQQGQQQQQWLALMFFSEITSISTRIASSRSGLLEVN